MLKALDGRVTPMAKGEEILSAPEKARTKMATFAKYFMRQPGAEVVKPTKTKLFSIAPKNPTNKATKTKGRLSALKDNIANATAGGREFKALMLNVYDELLAGGSLSEERLMDMLAEIGAATPFCMANVEGGAKHANKSVGPWNWLLIHCKDGVGTLPFFVARGRAIDLPVKIHQGIPHEYLERGAKGVIEYIVEWLERIRAQDGAHLFVLYDRRELVPLIKDREQAGRTKAVGESSLAFDKNSSEAISPQDLQAWLRRAEKAARDGVADATTVELLRDEKWTGPNVPMGDVFCYGVGGSPGLGCSGATGVPLLHFRRGREADRGVQRLRGPDVGEGELSVVHFIVQAEKYLGEKVTEWEVYSVDTDQWMIILLAMSTGFLQAAGEGCVKVAVEKRVGRESTFIYVNRVFATIVDLRDGSESAWPAADFQGWSPDENEKVRLYVLAYLLAGCDFLPAISGLGFERMWECALKSVRADGVFDISIFVRGNGTWNVDIEGCVKLLATIFYFKYEASFKDVCESPGELLRNVKGNVEEYVKCICFVILKFGTKRATTVCPAFESMRLQCLRANAVLGYWQDGCKEAMPPRDFKDQGWGVDPTLKNFASLDLNKENCVMWLSEHSYIGSDNKTKTLACTSCRPPTAGRPIICQRCRCNKDGRKCSLSCGCRGTCNERRFAQPAAQPRQPTTLPAQPAAPVAPVPSSNTPPMHNTVAGALRAMMATRAAVAAAAAAQAEAPPAATPAQDPPGGEEDNAPVVQKDLDVSEDDVDRIPDWLSDASGTSDVGSDGGSDGGWDMSLEDGSDGGSEWDFGDD